MDNTTADLYEECVGIYYSWLRKEDNRNPLDEPQGLDYPELTADEFKSAKEEAEKMYAQAKEEESW